MLVEPVADLDAGWHAKGFWRRRSHWQRASLVIQVLALTITGMMVLLSVGMWRDDMVINAHPVRATATVLTVSALSTGVEFVDSQGVSQRPPAGVLYPGGLVVGQQFLVEYAANEPSRVRVAGRSAINGLIMPLYVILGTWAAALPVLWWLRRRDRREPMDLAVVMALAGGAGDRRRLRRRRGRADPKAR